MQDVHHQAYIVHHERRVLNYNFTDIGRDDILFKAIIEQLNYNHNRLNPSDDYVHGLKFREILFDLKPTLLSYIEDVFLRFQVELRDNQGITTITDVRNICKSKYNERDYKRLPYYKFKNWNTDAWCLAQYFSPTLARNSTRRVRFEIDIHSLLEILEQFNGFTDLHRTYANMVKNERNKLYGHLSTRGISYTQYQTAALHSFLLQEYLADNPASDVNVTLA